MSLLSGHGWIRYASDIIAPGVMGWFIGKYVFDHHLDPNIHKRYETKPGSRFMPEISPARAEHAYIWSRFGLE